jgi:DNA-binding NarL/FixJ family response regulator
VFLAAKILVDFLPGKVNNGHVKLPLTPRQQLLFDLVAAGKKNPEIAQEMGITGNSVKTLVHRLKVESGARHRSEIADRIATSRQGAK